MRAANAIAVAIFLALAPVGFHGIRPQEPDPQIPQPDLQPDPKLPQPDPQPKDRMPAAPAIAVECRWAAGAIVLDGVLNEKSWKNAETLEFQVPWQDRKPKANATARLLWDMDYLYFCADMEDADLYADIKEPGGHLWDNDSLALFIKPSEQKLGYYQFHVSAASTPLEVFFPSRGGGGYNRFVQQTQLHFEGFVKVNGTLNDWTDKDKGWTVEARIPWTAFNATGGRPKAGDRWRFALCRYDFSVTLDQPELSTTAPLTRPDFHRYEDYQEILFVERK